MKPAGALLVVAGDVNAARVRQLATEAFASWTGAPAAAAAAPAIPARAATEIVLVHKPGAVQSNILAGFTFITPRDPAVYPLTIANKILGGGTDSRLFLILREQHGWTYGSYSSFSRPRGTGAFEANAEVRTAVTDSAVAEMLRQLDRIRIEVPADSEIAAAKNYLAGVVPAHHPDRPADRRRRGQRPAPRAAGRLRDPVPRAARGGDQAAARGGRAGALHHRQDDGARGGRRPVDPRRSSRPSGCRCASWTSRAAR